VTQKKRELIYIHKVPQLGQKLILLNASKTADGAVLLVFEAFKKINP